MEQTKQATILVVDDDEAGRKLLKALLAAEGHTVRSAASGEEALASVTQQLPDLILLDIMMPGMDGFEVTRRITRCVREVDTVARFGGDEFVVVLNELGADKAESTTQAGIIAEKIRATLAKPYVLKLEHEVKTETTVEHHCTSSIGVVLFINHEASPEDIIKWADIAMYQAKEAGGNLIRFYDSKVPD